jgi:ABC-type lipoprotein release transport system permease subunit
LLFEVAPTDIQMFVAAAVLLMIVAIAAGVIPARRAGSVDPLASLRLE